MDCISEDSLSHEYFFQLSGEELLDSLIAETNLLEKEIAFQKVTFEYALGSINRNLAILKNF